MAAAAVLGLGARGREMGGDRARGEWGEVQGKQETAWRSGLVPEAAEAGGGSGACRRAVATRLASFWREVGDGGGSVGWAAGGAGPGKWAPGKWLGFSLLFLF